MELQALGSVRASVLLIGRPRGTLPVRMRQAQLVLVFTTAARDRQQSAVGDDPPPFVLLVMYPRQGVKLVTSDAAHDVATACPDAGVGTVAARASSTVAAMANIMRCMVKSV
jgi:hypothetical protein